MLIKPSGTLEFSVKPYIFYHRGPYDVTAFNNDWGVTGAAIGVRIYDKQEVPTLGAVKY
jgi:hypothetical protein